MYDPAGVKTLPEFLIPGQMKAWVLGDSDELLLRDKPTPVPGRAEVLVRIDAVAICATDLEIIHGGSPASIGGGLPFNKNFTQPHQHAGACAGHDERCGSDACRDRRNLDVRLDRTWRPRRRRKR